MKDVSDLVAFNPLIDYLSEDSLEDVVYEENFAAHKYIKEFLYHLPVKR